MSEVGGERGREDRKHALREMKCAVKLKQKVPQSSGILPSSFNLS